MIFYHPAGISGMDLERPPEEDGRDAETASDDIDLEAAKKGLGFRVKALVRLYLGKLPTL